jgi:hypothetical protein
VLAIELAPLDQVVDRLLGHAERGGGFGRGVEVRDGRELGGHGLASGDGQERLLRKVGILENLGIIRTLGERQEKKRRLRNRSLLQAKKLTDPWRAGRLALCADPPRETSAAPLALLADAERDAFAVSHRPCKETIRLAAQAGEKLGQAKALLGASAAGPDGAAFERVREVGNKLAGAITKAEKGCSR